MDPITRIVGSLGIHTKNRFSNRRVGQCYSTSSIFAAIAYSCGQGSCDAHFITSRICASARQPRDVCGLCANSGFRSEAARSGGMDHQPRGAADYMFEHNLFQATGGVDFCEQMVRATNPGVLAKARRPKRRRRAARLPDHRRHMAGVEPLHGDFYSKRCK